MQQDLEFMALAVAQAERALDCAEVPVGCVFVRDGTVIGSGHNDTNRSQNGTRHAELCAIDGMLETHDAAVFRECDLYVTVEPCIMCAAALRQMHIRRVFFGAANDRFGGCGSVLAINQDSPQQTLGSPYEAYPNLLRREAIMLLRQFYTRQNPTAPQPKTKKQRIVKDEIPPLDYRLFVTKEQFLEYYPGADLAEYESGRAA